jgi:hypothetical protein
VRPSTASNAEGRLQPASKTWPYLTLHPWLYCVDEKTQAEYASDRLEKVHSVVHDIGRQVVRPAAPPILPAANSVFPCTPSVCRLCRRICLIAHIFLYFALKQGVKPTGVRGYSLLFFPPLTVDGHGCTRLRPALLNGGHDLPHHRRATTNSIRCLSRRPPFSAAGEHDGRLRTVAVIRCIPLNSNTVLSCASTDIFPGSPLVHSHWCPKLVLILQRAVVFVLPGDIDFQVVESEHERG